MSPIKKISFLFFLLSLVCVCKAQVVDTTLVNKIQEVGDTTMPIRISVDSLLAPSKIDSVKIKDPHARSPRKAAIRSAILPGWGQVYNRKAWKVPIVYAALGFTGWYFMDNLHWYKQTRLGVQILYRLQKNPQDSTGYNKINEDYVRDAVNKGRVNELTSYRDQFRKDIDYAAIYFLVAWALNVVEASVDAHLSTFDVSPNLAFEIKPGYSDLAKTNGISLVLRFK
ncbi:MAG: DUF5683 domain-containing protein [Niabella sp.]